MTLLVIFRPDELRPHTVLPELRAKPNRLQPSTLITLFLKYVSLAGVRKDVMHLPYLEAVG